MTKPTNSKIQSQCADYVSKMSEIQSTVSEMLKGRKAKIISNYNGQPYGTSKKPLKDKIITIKMVSIDSNGCDVWDGNYSRCFIPIGEVEILDYETDSKLPR